MAVSESSTQTNYIQADGHLDIPVDAEHGGIRLAGCLVLFGSFAFATLFFNLFVPDFLVLAAIGGVLTSALTTYLVDKFLRRHWPSGRHLVATTEDISLIARGTIERNVNPQKQVNVLMWRFIIKRSGRAKKGWYVIGLSLEQDGEYVPVYTFASPERMRELPLSDHLTELAKKRPVDGRSERELRLAGEQRRLYEAEQDRSIFGAEVTVEQFEQYILYLQQNYPKWMLQK